MELIQRARDQEEEDEEEWNRMEKRITACLCFLLSCSRFMFTRRTADVGSALWLEVLYDARHDVRSAL